MLWPPSKSLCLDKDLKKHKNGLTPQSESAQIFSAQKCFRLTNHNLHGGISYADDVYAGCNSHTCVTMAVEDVQTVN